MGKFLGTYMQTCIIKILGNNFQQQLQHPITKKADAEPKKSRSNKQSRCRTSLLKNGPTKLPCLLIILASWVDFFDIGLLLYPVPHHTLQCCTRKSFWVTRTGESKLFCIGFSLFWSRCRTWCTFIVSFPVAEALSSSANMGRRSVKGIYGMSALPGLYLGALVPLLSDQWKIQGLVSLI